MTIKEAFLAFTRERGLPAEEKAAQDGVTPVMVFKMIGDNGKYDAYAMCFEEEKLYELFVDSGFRIPEGSRLFAAECLTRMNYQFKLGGFQMDPESGEITVRLGQYIYGTDEEKKEAVDRITMIGGMMMDQYIVELIQQMP